MNDVVPGCLSQSSTSCCFCSHYYSFFPSLISLYAASLHALGREEGNVSSGLCASTTTVPGTRRCLSRFSVWYSLHSALSVSGWGLSGGILLACLKQSIQHQRLDERTPFTSNCVLPESGELCTACDNHELRPTQRYVHLNILIYGLLIVIWCPVLAQWHVTVSIGWKYLASR